MARGGARPGAGRKPGYRPMHKIKLHPARLQEGILPLDYMLSVLRNENADKKDRQWAAKEAAPYIHAKQTAEDTEKTKEISVNIVNFVLPDGYSKRMGASKLSVPALELSAEMRQAGNAHCPPALGER